MQLCHELTNGISRWHSDQIVACARARVGEQAIVWHDAPNFFPVLPHFIIYPMYVFCHFFFLPWLFCHSTSFNEIKCEK